MKNTDSNQGMSLIVKSVTDWLKGFILLYGIYIVLYGHLTPGGGFAGGVIIACAFILLTLAEGQKTSSRTLSKPVASELDSVGALMFLGVALAGLYRVGVFFKNVLVDNSIMSPFELVSAGTIPVCNIAIALKVGMSLFMVFTILAAVRVAITVDDRSRKEDN